MLISESAARAKCVPLRAHRQQ